VFSGNRADYTINRVGNTAANTFTVIHNNGGLDGTDLVRNVELLVFLDESVATSAVGAITVPNLTGLTAAAARTAIANAGLTVGTVSVGTHPTIQVNRVMEQDPLPGLGASAGSVVSFTLTQGASVPDIHEMSVADGSATLTAGGVTPGIVIDVNSDDIPVGDVAATNPPAGTIVPPGTTVNLLRSIGPATALQVPAVVGQDQGDGEEAIVAAGLTVGAITFANSNTIAAGGIASTNPVAGTVLTAGAPVAIVVSLGDGLVAEFGFNELDGGLIAFDSSPVALEGTIPAGARQPVRVPGQDGFGGALQFDGINDWVTVPDTAGSPIDLSNGMTLEAWVRPTAPMNGWETILMKERIGGTNPGFAYALYANDGPGSNVPAGYIRTNPITNSADRAARGTAPVAVNTWTHIAVTYTTASGGTLQFYVNGQAVGAPNVGVGNINQTNNPLRIGGNNVFPDEFFQGMIDDVRVYNRARTATQIQGDMNRPVR
jgi:beta-lactam-binding protein with PASTA domain